MICIIILLQHRGNMNYDACCLASSYSIPTDQSMVQSQKRMMQIMTHEWRCTSLDSIPTNKSTKDVMRHATRWYILWRSCLAFFDSAPTNKGCYKLWRMVLGIICPNPQKDDAKYDAFCPASFDSTPTHKCAHKHKCKHTRTRLCLTNTWLNAHNSASEEQNLR